MNWKVLALLPALTLAAAVPAYSLTNNKSHNTTNASYVAQNSQPQPGNTMKKPNAVQKLHGNHRSNSTANHSSVLRVGSRGEAVKTAQNSLKQQGFYTASVNGVFDNKTRSAVIQFQKAKGLRADGIIGHRTLASLK